MFCNGEKNMHINLLIRYRSTSRNCNGKLALKTHVVITKCICRASSVIKFEIPKESFRTKGKLSVRRMGTNM